MGKPALDVGRLTPEERLGLIEDLWESLGDERQKIPLTPEQQDAIDRRLDALDDAEPVGPHPQSNKECWRAQVRSKPHARVSRNTRMFRTVRCS